MANWCSQASFEAWALGSAKARSWRFLSGETVAVAYKDKKSVSTKQKVRRISEDY